MQNRRERRKWAISILRTVELSAKDMAKGLRRRRPKIRGKWIDQWTCNISVNASFAPETK